MIAVLVIVLLAAMIAVFPVAHARDPAGRSLPGRCTRNPRHKVTHRQASSLVPARADGAHCAISQKDTPMKLLRPAMQRRLVLAAPALLLLPAAAQVPPTPAQMEGPYYPRAIPADADADLRVVAGQPRAARGQLLLLEGTVRGRDGTPLAGTRVQIWQADASGIYLHPGDARVAERDPGFQGFGSTVADNAGRYAFRTIRPGLYPGRTPHIHLRATSADGRRDLTTQAYFPDSPQNGRDFLLRMLSAENRERLIMTLAATDEGQRARFDIVLG